MNHAFCTTSLADRSVGES